MDGGRGCGDGADGGDVGGKEHRGCVEWSKRESVDFRPSLQASYFSFLSSRFLTNQRSGSFFLCLGAGLSMVGSEAKRLASVSPPFVHQGRPLEGRERGVLPLKNWWNAHFQA